MPNGNPVKTLILIREVKDYMSKEKASRAAALKAVGARYGIKYPAMLARFSKIDGESKQFRRTVPQYRKLSARTIKKVKGLYSEDNIITSFVLYT